MSAIGHLITTHTEEHGCKTPKSFASDKSFSSCPHRWDLLRQGLLIMSIDGLITAGLISSFCRSQVMKILSPFLMRSDNELEFIKYSDSPRRFCF